MFPEGCALPFHLGKIDVVLPEFTEVFQRLIRKVLGFLERPARLLIGFVQNLFLSVLQCLFSADQSFLRPPLLPDDPVQLSPFFSCQIFQSDVAHFFIPLQMLFSVFLLRTGVAATSFALFSAGSSTSSDCPNPSLP